MGANETECHEPAAAAACYRPMPVPLLPLARFDGLPVQKLMAPALSHDTSGRPRGHQAQATAACCCLGSRSRAATTDLEMSHKNTVPSAEPAAACCSVGLQQLGQGERGAGSDRLAARQGC